MRTDNTHCGSSAYTQPISLKGLRSSVRDLEPLSFKSILPDYERIPFCLRLRQQWLPWRTELRHGKPSKVPVDPRTESRARWSNSEVLTSFKEALAYWKQGRADGLGFFFLDSDPYVGIDLDSCRNDAGSVRLWARRIIDEFGSYAEVSPSGTGIKLIIRATKPSWSGCKVPKEHIEKFRPTSPSKAVEIALTDSRGYFALTGNVYRYGKIRSCTKQLDSFCHRYWNEEPDPPACALRSSELSDNIDRRARLEIQRRISIADNAPPHDGEGGQSRHDFALICWLLLEGIDPEAAWSAMRGHSKFARRGRPYFETTLANVRKALRIVT